jgi:2-polyprenyl-6-methoxyphenol hydroxylase-like FAD-dependent oxidoreductase
VVVGAGPCGAALAVRLARAGLPVTLVEAASRFTRSFRGEALMPSGLAALERLGLLPLPATVPQRALSGWQVSVNGRLLFRLDEPLEGSDGAPCTLVSQAAWLEYLLAEPARPAALALRTGVAVTSLQHERSGRVNGVVLADGDVLPADLVVACDGRSSRLRELAGIGLECSSAAIDVLWFRFRSGAAPLPDGTFTTLVGQHGLASLFKGASGLGQLGWAIPSNEATPTLSPAAWMERLAAMAPPALASWLRHNGRWLEEPVRFSVVVGQAEQWWRPGLLLLGDAAHPMSPVRAQGINMALRDAAVAAEALMGLRSTQQVSQQLTMQLTVQLLDQLDNTLAAIEAARRPEVQRLQALQAEELSRGERLRNQPLLRQLLAAGAPLVGNLVGQHWRRQQQPLRHGLTTLESR